MSFNQNNLLRFFINLHLTFCFFMRYNFNSLVVSNFFCSSLGFLFGWMFGISPFSTLCSNLPHFITIIVLNFNIPILKSRRCILGVIFMFFYVFFLKRIFIIFTSIFCPFFSLWYCYRDSILYIFLGSVSYFLHQKIFLIFYNIYNFKKLLKSWIIILVKHLSIRVNRR